MPPVVDWAPVGVQVPPEPGLEWTGHVCHRARPMSADGCRRSPGDGMLTARAAPAAPDGGIQPLCKTAVTPTIRCRIGLVTATADVEHRTRRRRTGDVWGAAQRALDVAAERLELDPGMHGVLRDAEARADGPLPGPPWTMAPSQSSPATASTTT